MIRIYEGPTADHVWQQLAEAFRRSDGVHAQPSRGGPTREILHTAISFADPRQRWVVSREPPLNVAFALAEVVWIMTGRRDLAFLEF
jgi:thymidylate synthase